MRTKFPIFSFQFSSEEGQSLIEVIIALTIAVIVILALVRVTVTSIRNAAFARNRSQATRYSQEWMEEAREMRDDQGDAFFTDSFATNPCGASDTVGIFTRARTCGLNGETMSVVVEVEWNDAAGPHKSELETRLTNWK